MSHLDSVAPVNAGVGHQLICVLQRQQIYHGFGPKDDYSHSGLADVGQLYLDGPCYREIYY